MASRLSSERHTVSGTSTGDSALIAAKERNLAASTIAVALAVALLAGCSASWSSDQGKKIAPKGSTYSYKVPHGWLIEAGNAYKVEGRSFQTAVHGQTGLAAISVSQQSITEKVTSSNRSAFEDKYKSVAAKWQFPPTNWRKTSLAGVPALSYHRSGTSAGETREIDAYVAFKGSDVFFVDCMYTPDTQSDVAKACNSVVNTFLIK